MKKKFKTITVGFVIVFHLTKNHYTVKIDLMNMIGIFCFEDLENIYLAILLNQNSCGVKACQYKHII